MTLTIKEFIMNRYMLDDTPLRGVVLNQQGTFYEQIYKKQTTTYELPVDSSHGIWCSISCIADASQGKGLIAVGVSTNVYDTRTEIHQRTIRYTPTPSSNSLANSSTFL
jgi:hypothetical protein